MTTHFSNSASGTGIFVASYFAFCYYISRSGFISFLALYFTSRRQATVTFSFVFCCVNVCYRKKSFCIDNLNEN